MRRWTAFADLTFSGSARLAFARALEQAATDAFQTQGGAWLVEDRRIPLALETESSLPVLEGTRRLLAALVLDAVAGEAVLECEHPPERWARHAPAASTCGEITVRCDDSDPGETIPTAAC